MIEDPITVNAEVIKAANGLLDQPMSLRRAVDQKAYGDAKLAGDLVPLADEPTIEEFAHWRMIENRFPYSIAFQTHHLLLPKRKVANMRELNLQEFHELQYILDDVTGGHYDLWFVNVGNRRSVPDHFHIHFAKYVEHRKEMML